MQIAGRDLHEQVLIVAEIGLNHEGSITLAQDLIGRAAAAGVDAVKFQTYRTEDYVSRDDRERFERLESFRLADEHWKTLADEARLHRLGFLSTPFDTRSLALLAPLVDAVKIASSDNTFSPLLAAAADTGKPMIISTGLSTEAEIESATGLVRNAWTRRGMDPGLALLHCVSAYPTPDDEVNLAAIRTLRERFGTWVGYSDHSRGVEAAVLAVAAGARIIEKHFTIDCAYSSFRDHQLSADPDTMTQLVRRVRMAERMLGDGVRSPQPCEREHVTALRRSTIFRRDMNAGEVLAAGDVTWVRPGGGIPPGAETSLLGRPLAASVRAGDRLTTDALEPVPCAMTEA